MEFLADFAKWVGERTFARLFFFGILVIPVVLFISHLMKDYDPKARDEKNNDSKTEK